MATRDEIMALVDAPLWASDEELFSGKAPAIARAIADELEALEYARWILVLGERPFDMWSVDIKRKIDLARFFVAAFKLGAGMIKQPTAGTAEYATISSYVGTGPDFQCLWFLCCPTIDYGIAYPTTT